MTNRVVALIDMDCFYCQVEERLNPTLKGKPTAVVQYNPWNGGGIIAVNYEARGQGVKRGMRGEHAKQLCPDIMLCSVPVVREKADLARYRDAGREVVNVMCQFTGCVQRASIDEAYIDLTKLVEDRLAQLSQSVVASSSIPNTFVVGYTDESSAGEADRAAGTASWLDDVYSSELDDVNLKKLAVGAVIVEEMRRAIDDATGFKCSAGIAHNKILAKLSAGFHKPNRQTVLPHQSVPQLFATLPLYKIKNLGGKLGRELEDVHGVRVMADLLKFTKEELVKLCDQRMGNWLYNAARGYDHEPVSPRLTSKSIACCKNFPGPLSLSRGKDVEDWLNKLTLELLGRLSEDETLNQRKAQQMVVAVRLQRGNMADKGDDIGSSKSVPFLNHNHEKTVNSARACLKKLCAHDPSTDTWSCKITFLGLSAGKFVHTNGTLKQLFHSMNSRQRSRQLEAMTDVQREPLKRETNTNVEEVFLDNAEEPPKVLRGAVGASDPVTDRRLGQLSCHDESAGPSFFERMLLEQSSCEGDRSCVSGGNEKDDDDVVDSVAPNPKTATITTVNRNLTESRSKAGSLRSIVKMSKPSQEAVTSFFTRRPTSLVDPIELFPDMSDVDESTLALLPLSYRRRVIELKRPRGETVVNCTPSNEAETEPFTSRPQSAAPALPSPTCPDCERTSWPTTELQDAHRDYHFALRLHQELNPDSSPSTSAAPRSHPPSLVSQHKRKTPLKRCKLPDAKKPRSIEVFFKKSSSS